jgi:hypothetical protein
MKRIRFLAGLTLVALFGPTAFAIPISYDEAANGDLEASPPAIFGFEAGRNRVSGQVVTVFQNGVLALFDSDFFNFTIGDGLALSNVVFQYEATLLDGTTLFQFQTHTQFFRTTPPLSLDTVQVTLYNAAIQPQLRDRNVLDAFLPIAGPTSTGRYRVVTNGLTRLNGTTSTIGAIVDYTWTFDVRKVQVPEPPTLYVLMAGLLALLWVGRRPRRS